jgi:hypothetical protein
MPVSTQAARLRAAGLRFRNELVTGPGASQIPAGLFQPRG